MHVRAAVASRSGSAEDDDRLSRRTFLVGLGAAAGATAFLGVAALLRADPSNAVGSPLADVQDGATGQGSGGNGWQGGQGNGWQDGGSSQSGGSTAIGQRVSVDAGACIGCGRCLSACPYGVFSLAGGRAVAQDPAACRLCGRCLQVCPEGAITLAT
jgi:NAD-dependent dihydropyrimidine dehydrogenase PreA subunit